MVGNTEFSAIRFGDENKAKKGNAEIVADLYIRRRFGVAIRMPYHGIGWNEFVSG
jgi:hypothetical protein